MSTLATAVSAPPHVSLGRPRAALLLTAALFAATFLVGVVGDPHTQHGLTKTADYLYTALLPPICVAMTWTLLELRRLHAGHEDRLGGIGLALAGLGLAGFCAAGVATLATASTDTQGPLYPLALLVTLAGLACFGVASARAHVVPRRAGAALPIAWLVGFPTLTNDTVPVLIVVLLAFAAALPRGQVSRPR